MQSKFFIVLFSSFFSVSLFAADMPNVTPEQTFRQFGMIRRARSGSDGSVDLRIPGGSVDSHHSLSPLSPCGQGSAEVAGITENFTFNCDLSSLNLGSDFEDFAPKKSAKGTTLASQSEPKKSAQVVEQDQQAPLAQQAAGAAPCPWAQGVFNGALVKAVTEKRKIKIVSRTGACEGQFPAAESLLGKKRANSDPGYSPSSDDSGDGVSGKKRVMFSIKK